MDELNSLLDEGISIHISHWLKMFVDVSERRHEEACGLVAGQANSSRAVYFVTNILHSAVRYRMDPYGQLNSMVEIDKRGWNIMAIYHSHLHGPTEPSPTDIAEFSYPCVVSLIWSRDTGVWICRGYLIQEGNVSAVRVNVVNTE